MENGELGEHGAGMGLPGHTTPTWEVELLISGVAVFAMLQVPGWLDDGMFALYPRLDAAWAELLKLLYIYARSAAMILGATFVIHLLLRARWIALVGMHSVYPDGIRWERLRIGPLQRRIEASLDRGADAAIDAADNGATTVFSIGVMMAIMIAIVAALLLVVAGSLTWAGPAVGLPIHPFGVLFVLMGLFIGSFGLLNLSDRTLGSRLRVGGAGERWISAGLRFYARLGLARSNNRIMALLGSHVGERKMTALTVVLMAGTVTMALAWYSGLQQHDRLGSYALFPVATDALPVVDAAHYDDQRDVARDPAVPFVQAAVVTGPYLRLVVPYIPRRDAPALQSHCAAIRGTATPGTAAASMAILQCLRRLHAVSLDGTPLVGLEYAVGNDARTDRPALEAMIDVRGLAPGRHELRVQQPPERGAEDTDDADAAGADTVVRIPFWR